MDERSKPLEGMKILVAEDTSDIQLLFNILLSSAGATVDLASDGLEAVEKACEAEYDLILMDLRMPGISGHEATMALRNKGFSNPVVAITAHLDAREITACQNSGFSGCIEKSLTKEKLISRILGLVAC